MSDILQQVSINGQIIDEPHYHNTHTYVSEDDDKSRKIENLNVIVSAGVMGREIHYSLRAIPSTSSYNGDNTRDMHDSSPRVFLLRPDTSDQILLVDDGLTWN